MNTCCCLSVYVCVYMCDVVSLQVGICCIPLVERFTRCVQVCTRQTGANGSAITACTNAENTATDSAGGLIGLTTCHHHHATNTHVHCTCVYAACLEEISHIDHYQTLTHIQVDRLNIYIHRDSYARVFNTGNITRL